STASSPAHSGEGRVDSCRKPTFKATFAAARPYLGRAPCASAALTFGGRGADTFAVDVRVAVLRRTRGLTRLGHRPQMEFFHLARVNLAWWFANREAVSPQPHAPAVGCVKHHQRKSESGHQHLC